MSFVVGVLILTPWPQGSLTFLGFLVSLELIFTGASYLGLGLNLSINSREDKSQSHSNNSKEEDKNYQKNAA